MKYAILCLLLIGLAASDVRADEPRLLQTIGRGDILDAQWSPSGDHILVQTSAGAWIYDSRLHDVGVLEGVMQAAYSPDGRYIAGMQPDRSVIIYDAVTLERYKRFAPPVKLFAWSPQPDIIAVVWEDDTRGYNGVWHLESETQRTLPAREYRQLAWNADGTWLAALRDEAPTVELVAVGNDLSPTALLPMWYVPYPYPGGMPVTVQWCPSGELLADIDGRQLIWHEVTTNTQTALDIDEWFGNDRTDNERSITLLTAIAPDCNHATTFAFGVPANDRMYNLRERREIGLGIPGSWTTFAAWAPSGQLVAFLHDGIFPKDRESVYVAEMRPNGTNTIMSVNLSVNGILRPTALRWSPSENRLLVVGGDHSLTVVDSRHGTIVARAVSHSLPGIVVSLSDDGQRVAVADKIGAVHIYDADGTLDEVITTGHTLPVSHLAWQPGGIWLATGSGGLFAESDRTVRLWDTSGMNPDIVIYMEAIGERDTNAVLDLTWSFDGARIAVSDLTGNILIVNPEGSPYVPWSYLRVTEPDGRESFRSPISFLRWSHNGTRLAGTYYDSGGIYPMAWIPQTRTLGGIGLVTDGDRMRIEGGVGDVAWRPDGRWVLMRWIKHAHNFSPENMQPSIQIEGLDPVTRLLAGLPRGVSSGGLSPDGLRAYGYDGQGAAALWDAESGAVLKRWANGAGGALWSPNSSRFAVVVGDLIGIYDHEGRRVSSIVSGGWIMAWSFDGSTLAVNTNGVLQIWGVGDSE